MILLSSRLGASSLHKKDVGSYIQFFFICRRLERLIGLVGGLMGLDGVECVVMGIDVL